MSVYRADKTEVETGCGTLHVSRVVDGDKPKEVFYTIGKAGGCALSFSEAQGRMTSLIFQEADLDKLKQHRPLANSVEDEIIKELRSIQCHLPVVDTDETTGAQIKILSCPDAIAEGLQRIKDETQKQVEGDEDTRI